MKPATIAEVIASAHARTPKATRKAVAVDNQGIVVAIAAVEAGETGTLRAVAYDFCAKANVTNGDLVASWPGAPLLKSGRVIAKGEVLPDDDPIVGIDILKGHETHWFVAIRPHDDSIIEAARAGNAGLSLEAS